MVPVIVEKMDIYVTFGQIGIKKIQSSTNGTFWNTLWSGSYPT